MLKLNLKLFTIGLIIILLSSAIGSSINLKSNALESSSESDSYLIEGVPYAAQTDFGCFYGSLEMLFKYYGKNSSLEKNFFYSGGGYSFCYERKKSTFIKPPIPRPPYLFKILRSSVAVQGSEDTKFMGSLYGLNMSSTYPDHVVINHEKHWNEWWPKVKNHIDNDDPVITSLDPCAWPIYLEIFNLTEPINGRGGHVIVIVGYNESNSTVCVQDPMAGSDKYYNPDRIGYQWIDISDLKLAEERSFWEMKENGYEIFTIEDIFDTPNQDDAFKTAHDRNIMRLSGDKEAYDSDYINPQFNKFGIEGLKSLRNDFKSLKFYFLYPALKLMGFITGLIDPSNQMPFNYDAGLFELESKSQKVISEFLQDIKTNLTDENLTEICDYDSNLLNQNSDNFLELANHTYKLQDAVSDNFLLKGFIEAKPILDDIVSTLDEIISIQEQIIAGPQGSI